MENNGSSLNTPRHMRDGWSSDSIASVGTDMFQSFTEALNAGQGKRVTLLKSCTVTEPLNVCTAGTVIDLNHNTLVLRNPRAASSNAKLSMEDFPCLTVSAPGVCIMNGRLAVLSGANCAIALRKVLHKPELRLDGVGVAYEGLGYALRIMEGIALLQDSRIESSTSGIYVCSPNAHVGISATRIIAQKRAVALDDGRFIAEGSIIAGRNQEGIFAKKGFLGLFASQVGSYDSAALRTSAGKDGSTPLYVKLCECSEATSIGGEGMLIEGGNVTVIRSIVRSVENTAVKVGSTKSFAHARLSIAGASVVSSWRGNSIQHISGELYVSNTIVQSVFGNETNKYANAQQIDINDYALD